MVHIRTTTPAILRISLDWASISRLIVIQIRKAALHYVVDMYDKLYRAFTGIFV